MQQLLVNDLFPNKAYASAHTRHIRDGIGNKRCALFIRYANHISMTSPSSYAKDFGNLLYHSAIVGGLSVGYSIIGKGC